jgi:PAS domain S-box-containing protein
MFRKSGQTFKVTLIYTLLGVAWIYGSTLLLNTYFTQESGYNVNVLSILMQGSFVLVSGLLLYILLNSFHVTLQRRITEYEKLFMKNPNPMWVYDLDTLSFLAVNEAAMREYGYTEKEFLERTICDIRPAEDIPRLHEAIRGIPQGVYSSGIWRHVKKDGTLIWVQITSYAMEWHGKRAELILSQNVTERVNFEQQLHDLNVNLEEKITERTRQLDEVNNALACTNEELITTNEELLSTNDQLSAAHEKIQEQANDLVRQSQQKLSSILSTLKDMVWSAKFIGMRAIQIDFVNNAAEEIFGYSAQEFYENNNLLSECMLVEDPQGTVDAMHQQLLAKSYTEIEHMILSKQRKQKWVTSRIWMTKDYTGKPVRLDGIITDITLRKKAEHELIRQKEALQRLIDNLPLIIVLFDAQRNINFINQFWESTFEQADGAIGKEYILQQFFPGNLSTKETLAFIRSRDGEWHDFKIEAPSGLIDISWCMIPLSDDSIIGIGQDISHRKKQEEEKSKLLQQLVMHNNDLLQFSFIASHNLRGPVATIMGLSKLIEIQPIENQELNILHNHLFTSVNKLNEVIKDLTKILEIRGDHYQSKQWLDIADLYKSIQETLALQLISGEVEIRTDFSAYSHFFTIKTYFYSILYNLVSNAIKYRSPHRPALIEIKTFQSNGHVGFFVRDNGIGIDLKQFGNKLFTLYQRFHLDVEGKGLGLYLVRTQVNALNGSIDVNSKPGQGATFTVSFPAPSIMPD